MYLQESTEDEADNATKASEEPTAVAENSSEVKNESIEKMDVDADSKVSKGNDAKSEVAASAEAEPKTADNDIKISESAITETVKKSEEKAEATSTTAVDGETAKVSTNDPASATIEIDDSSDDSNNQQKLPNAQSNDDAVTQSEDAKSTELPSVPATETKAGAVEKSAEPAVAPVVATPINSKVSAAEVASTDQKQNAATNDDAVTVTVTVNDANAKPQEAANGTKKDAVPTIKIDEVANENEKKTEKLVTCKCSKIHNLQIYSSHEMRVLFIIKKKQINTIVFFFFSKRCYRTNSNNNFRVNFLEQ